MSQPPAPPEAVLLRLARDATGMSSPDAARAIGISKARLSQIENGYETRSGEYRPVRGKDSIIARLAALYGVSPERLEQAGRDRAAEVLREIRRTGAPLDDRPEIVRANWDDENIQIFWSLTVSVAQRMAFIEQYLADKIARDDGESEGHALEA